MLNKRGASLFREIVDQAENPPGGDLVLASFYLCLKKEILADSKIGKFIVSAFESRADSTAAHFVNLVYRAVQFIKLEEGDLSYLEVKSTHKWHSILSKILQDKSKTEVWTKLLINYSTTTTIYQRYAGVYAIISKHFDSQNVDVIDLGCGGNYGLRGIETKEKFDKFVDDTTGNQILDYSRRPINLQRGLAVDLLNPDDELIRKWRIACSFYPSEYQKVAGVLDFEGRLQKSSQVKFKQADLLSDTLDFPKAEVVIISTVLYQFNDRERRLIIKKAKRLVGKKGLLIVQDFARLDELHPADLYFGESWFKDRFSYRTFVAQMVNKWKFEEVLQWSNGRCKEVRQGADFGSIFK